jgi:hypothetical protein
VSELPKGVKYEGKSWTVMTRNVHTQYDDLLLPVYEKMEITIIRKMSESERKKYYESTPEFGKLKYSELKKLL